jgi:hypothetical protein
MDTDELFNFGVTLMKAQAEQLAVKQPLCTICGELLCPDCFDYDPYNGTEIQQCDGCAEHQHELSIQNYWG